MTHIKLKNESKNRKVPFVVGEYYHLYNRGVEKRDIFIDNEDLNRFLKSLTEFNTVEPIGSIYEHSFGSPTPKSRSLKLISIVAYCLNPNHYHLLVTPLKFGGIQKFMHRLGTGYTNYFNERYDRSGALFQGRYKDVHVSSNEQLLHLSAYINKSQ